MPRGLQELGFTEGMQVVVEATCAGEVRLIPVRNLREVIRASGQKMARQHDEALNIIAESEDAPRLPDRTSTVAD